MFGSIRWVYGRNLDTASSEIKAEPYQASANAPGVFSKTFPALSGRRQ
jgi:hypothetical protein